MKLLFVVAPALLAAEPAGEVALDEPAAEEPAPPAEAPVPPTPAPLPPSDPAHFEVAVTRPPERPLSWSELLPTLGLRPVPTETYTPDMAVIGLWQSRWERALYPEQVTTPFPGMDETPASMVGQGLGNNLSGHSSFDATPR